MAFRQVSRTRTTMLIGIKTMVWTVDADAEIRRWLADPRVAVLITNRPADAVAMRSVSPAASPGP